MKRLIATTLLLPTLLFAAPLAQYAVGATADRTIRIDFEVRKGDEVMGNGLLTAETTVRYEGDNLFALQIRRIVADGNFNGYGPQLIFNGRYDTAAENCDPALVAALTTPILVEMDEEGDPEVLDAPLRARFQNWPVAYLFVQGVIPQLSFEHEFDFKEDQAVCEGETISLTLTDGDETNHLSWNSTNPILRQWDGAVDAPIREGMRIIGKLTLRSEPGVMDAIVDRDPAETRPQQFDWAEAV